MEKKIKTLYILSIIAILAFLVMQGYWLYVRYDYSLSEYEDATYEQITDALTKYNNYRASHSAITSEETRIQSLYNMNHDVDSDGNQKRTVTVTTRQMNGRKLLGITENRKLTPDELKRLEKIVLDSLQSVDEKKMNVDVTDAPSDGIAWNAMRNFESEIISPFTVEGIDSILQKQNIDAKITLAVTDSLIWDNSINKHTSIRNPHFIVTHPYSELEKKSVVIDCKIPTSEVIREMGRTLVLAVVLSIFLIACLIWQIKTIVKLTRLDKMRNMFVTTMIHELKRPISTLKMCVSGIESDRLMEDEVVRKEVAGETRMALDNLSAYFSKLRDITFNNVTQIPLNISSFNLSELVDTILKTVPISGTKKVGLYNEVPADIEISADKSHMSNIMTNLIENAVKYSGNDVSIIIRAEMGDGKVTIDVKDNGYGISSTDKGKIFNRFYRGKASSTDIPGMGLGLAYVKLLLDAHCGDISVESNEGAGSTFTVKLPQ